LTLALIVASPTSAPWNLQPDMRVATSESLEHVTELVRSTVLSSLYVPTTLNCWSRPLLIVASVGEIARLTRTLSVTSRRAAPEMPRKVATTCAVPGTIVSTRPLLPAALDTFATPEEPGASTAVQSATSVNANSYGKNVPWWTYRPQAPYWTSTPAGTEEWIGSTSIALRTRSRTSNETPLLVTPCWLALTVQVPGSLPVATPLAEMLHGLPFDTFHATDVVRSGSGLRPSL
jgi:hypothetical protein